MGVVARLKTFKSSTLRRISKYWPLIYNCHVYQSENQAEILAFVKRDAQIPSILPTSQLRNQVLSANSISTGSHFIQHNQSIHLQTSAKTWAIYPAQYSAPAASSLDPISAQTEITFAVVKQTSSMQPHRFFLRPSFFFASSHFLRFIFFTKGRNGFREVDYWLRML